DRAVLLEAGFELTGVDLDLASSQRLTLYLTRVSAVSTDDLRALRKTHEQQHTLHGLLTAILEAEELASRVDLEDLDYSELEVHVGPVPTARVCWRPASTESVPTPPVLTSTPVSSIPPMVPQGGFFEPRPQAAPPAPVVP